MTNTRGVGGKMGFVFVYVQTMAAGRSTRGAFLTRGQRRREREKKKTGRARPCPARLCLFEISNRVLGGSAVFMFNRVARSRLSGAAHRETSGGWSSRRPLRRRTRTTPGLPARRRPGTAWRSPAKTPARSATRTLHRATVFRAKRAGGAGRYAFVGCFAKTNRYEVYT